MVVYHLANTGSHELQKPPKATYVTPYPQKNKYSLFTPWDSQPLPPCVFWTLRFFFVPGPSATFRGSPFWRHTPAQANGGSMSGKDMWTSTSCLRHLGTEPQVLWQNRYNKHELNTNGQLTNLAHCLRVRSSFWDIWICVISLSWSNTCYFTHTHVSLPHP